MTAIELSRILENVPDETLILFHEDERSYAETEIIGIGLRDPSRDEEVGGLYIQLWGPTIPLFPVFKNATMPNNAVPILALGPKKYEGRRNWFIQAKV